MPETGNKHKMGDLFLDEKFDFNNTIQYILSIQVTPDGFSFLISSLAGKVLASQNSPLKISSNNLASRHLNDWIQINKLMLNEFESVRFFVFEELFSVIPDDLSGEIFSGFSTREKEVQSTVVKNRIDSMKATLQFNIAVELHKVIFNFYPNAEIVHPIAAILKKGYPFGAETLNSAFLIRLKNLSFLIICRKEKVLLAQGFEILHENDLLYHVINIFQQLQLSRSQTRLIIEETVISGIETVKLFAPYFPEMGKLENSGDLTNALHRFLHF
jgi:hypothetical protein